MHFSILACLVAAVAVTSASPTPTIVKRASCTGTFSYTNTEGGGGDGEAPVDSTTVGFGITGGTTAYSNDITPSKSYDFTVAPADYGGSPSLDVQAVLDLEGLAYTSCEVSPNGGDFIQGTATQNIDSNYVSTTTSTCIIVFDC